MAADPDFGAPPPTRVIGRLGDLARRERQAGEQRLGDALERWSLAANRAWLADAIRLAESAGMRGLVVVTQANPWEASRDKAYEGLLAQLAAGARRLAKPLLLVHGHTHTYRFDRPLRDAQGAVVGNARRLESFGSPVVGWVRVTVDPADDSLFRAEPHPGEAAGG